MKPGTALTTVVRTPRGVVSIAVGLAAVGLALSAIGSGAAASVSPEAGRPVPADAVSRLMAIAAGIVKANGGHRPAWETVVVTTHAKALESATPGDTTVGDGTVVVYLITIKGRFTSDFASGPEGASAPTGTYFSAVVNARTFAVTDGGLSDKPPPVAPGSLGPVMVLMR